MEQAVNLAKRFGNGETACVSELYEALARLQGCSKCARSSVDHLRSYESTRVQGSREWKQKRQSLVTASECASVLGRNPYQTADKLLMTKCNVVKFNGNKFTKHGQDMEGIAIHRYEQETGHTVRSFGLLVNPLFPWIGGSPDGITDCGRLIEVKCPVMREIILGEVPRMYIDQIQMLLHITGLEVADFIEMKGAEEFQIVEVKKDPSWWIDNKENLHTFHQRLTDCKADPTLCPRPKKRKPRFDFG